jgi:hypothetical protein
MKPKKSPQEKKKLDGRKQRRGFSEYAHSLRHGKWRKKKRRPAQKSERQAERLAVSTPAAEVLTDQGFDPGSIQRPIVAKWGATPLVQWIVKRRATARPALAGRRSDVCHAADPQGVDRGGLPGDGSDCDSTEQDARRASHLRLLRPDDRRAGPLLVLARRGCRRHLANSVT